MLGAIVENKDNTIVHDNKNIAVAFKSDGFKNQGLSANEQRGAIIATQEEGEKPV